MIAELFGVTVGGALLGATVDLTHGGVEIDHQILIAGTGTQLPRPPQQPGRDGVELTHRLAGGKYAR